jgi:hypothetical protein
VTLACFKHRIYTDDPAIFAMHASAIMLLGSSCKGQP